VFQVSLQEILISKATYMESEAFTIQKVTVEPEFNVKEALLTELCQKNDSKAQEILYNRYANIMMRICLRYMKEEQTAEDVMIGGFVKVFNKISTFEFRGAGSLDGWIKRIMVNESLMALRKRKKELVGLEVVHQKSEEACIESKFNQEDIFKVVQNLPKGYRTVFNMYAIEGYSHKEIAAYLKISENTSKSQLSKARSSLKKSLNKMGLI